MLCAHAVDITFDSRCTIPVSILANEVKLSSFDSLSQQQRVNHLIEMWSMNEKSARERKKMEARAKIGSKWNY